MNDDTDIHPYVGEFDAPVEKRVARSVIDLSQISCPACGRSDRWDAIVTREPIQNNPELVVMCDCGVGELRVIVE